MNFELPCVHVAPKKGPPFLNTRARIRQEKLLQPEKGCQLTCDGIRLRNGLAASLRPRKTRCRGRKTNSPGTKATCATFPGTDVRRGGSVRCLRTSGCHKSGCPCKSTADRWECTRFSKMSLAWPRI